MTPAERTPTESSAAYPFNLIAFNRTTFRDLSDVELASVLVHESTHLEQSLWLKAYSNIVSLGVMFVVGFVSTVN